MPAASVTRKTTRKPAAEPVAKPPAEAGKGSAAGTAREPAAATPRKKSPAVAVVAALLVEKAAGSRKGSKTVGSETETVSAALPKLPRTRRAAAKQASAAPSLPLEGLAAPVRPGRTKKQAAAAPEPAPPKSRGK
jgi:hypothetical protein